MPLHCFSYINTNDKEYEREGKEEGERMEIDVGKEERKKKKTTFFKGIIHEC